MASIQGIYIALFGRPADPTGLTFFNGVTQNGADLAAIGDLASTAEYQDRFEGKSTVEIIVDIYQSLYGRNPDQAGLTFFADALASGRQTINTIAINILDGAQNEDLAIVNNKIAAANLYTEALDQPDEVAAYNGNTAAELGRQFLAPITADAASIPDTEAVDAAINQLEIIGNTQTLSEGVDILTGTIFNAPRGFTPGGTDQVNTLNDDDVLTGTGPNATLNFSYVNDADTGDASVAPTLKGVANINVDVRLDAGTSTFDLQDATGVLNLKINGIDNGTTFIVDNIQEVLKTLTVEETHSDDSKLQVLFVDNALEGTADSLKFTVSDAQIGPVFIQEVAGSPDQGFEEITLESTGAANIINGLIAEDLKSLVIIGDESLRLGEDEQSVSKEFIDHLSGLANVVGSLTSIDASGLGAALTINIGTEVTANLDGKSGTKVDFTFVGTKFDDAIRLFPGLDSAGDKIDGGEGNDTLQVFKSVTIGTVTGVETLDIRSFGKAVTVDASLFTGLESILVRDEGGATPTTLNKLTSDLINNISIQHGVTGSNDISSNFIIANLATQTANDTAKFTWADQLDGEDRLINTDPRFNTIIVADKVESITLVDNDSESNTVVMNPDPVNIQPFELSNTLKLEGGSAGTFLNLDFLGIGGGVNLYDKAMDGSENDGKFIIDAGQFLATRYAAATIDASAYLGDVIVRVDTLRDSLGVALPGGGQAITMGVGNDTVIFDFLNDTTAGLSISDTVKGGEGLDTLAIDGDGVKINLSASEWTNVSGFETIRLIGNNTGGTNSDTSAGAADAYGRNSYNLTLSNDLIANNGSTVTGGRRIEIINDNDLTNEATGTANVNTSRGVTIDARSLNAQSNFSYNGEEGANRTDDRFIMSDANVNGLALIDGGYTSFNSVNSNFDILEIRNSAVVTVGDLSGLKNIGTIEFTNDQAATQTAVLQLDSATVDALADSTHTATPGQVEIIDIRARDNPLVPGAFTVLSLDASQVSNSFRLIVGSGGGDDTITLGAGNDSVTGGLGRDVLTGGAGSDTFLLIDQVKVAGGATTVEADLITDFSVAQNDRLGFSISDLGEHGDQYAAGKNVVRIDNAATDLASGDGVALVKISAATDLGAVAGNVIVLDGNFVDVNAVETAIINGGSRELKFNGQFDKGDSFLVVYDDGANTHVALVTATADTANDAKIADATKIDTVDLVTLTAVSDATTLTNASFLSFFG